MGLKGVMRRIHWIRTSVICVAMLVLAGCTTLQQGLSDLQAAGAQPSNSPQTAPWQAFVAKAPVGSSQSFAKTPWGTELSLTLTERYFSATGKDCVRLKISPATPAAASAIACGKNGQWQRIDLIGTAGEGR